LRPGSQPALEGLGKLLVLFLALQALATAWRMIAGVAGSQQGLAEVVQAQLTGPLFFSFWFFEVLLGMAAPAVILLGPWRRVPKLLALAASLPVIAMYFVRYNFVQAGQMLSLKPTIGHLGESITYAPPFKGNVAGFLPYTPSLVEVLISLGAVAGVIVLFVALARALRFTKEA
jgi:molybdopterin-containing oxidoreductase family membrane subunit